MFVGDVPRCKVSGLHPVLGIGNDVFRARVPGAKDAPSGEPGLESLVAHGHHGEFRSITRGPGRHYGRLVR